MSKYIIPEINISIFDSEICTSISGAGQTDYVPGLDGFSDGSRTSLNFSELKEVTKFIF